MKNQKGITLVALVITIIVLLILAGVSISLVIGNNGVLTQASSSVVTNKVAAVKEDLTMALAACETTYYTKWAQDPSKTRKQVYDGTGDGSLANELSKKGYTLTTEKTARADANTPGVATDTANSVVGAAVSLKLTKDGEVYEFSFKYDNTADPVIDERVNASTGKYTLNSKAWYTAPGKTIKDVNV